MSNRAVSKEFLRVNSEYGCEKSYRMHEFDFALPIGTRVCPHILPKINCIVLLETAHTHFLLGIKILCEIQKAVIYLLKSLCQSGFICRAANTEKNGNFLSSLFFSIALKGPTDQFTSKADSTLFGNAKKCSKDCYFQNAAPITEKTEQSAQLGYPVLSYSHRL